MKLKALVLLLIGLPFAAFGNDAVHVSHRVVGVESVGEHTQVHIEFTIHNLGDKNLRNLRFSPEGIEFISGRRSAKFFIPHLQVKGATTILWTGSSNLAPQYFAQETPLFFLMEAVHRNGQVLQLPVISNNGEV